MSVTVDLWQWRLDDPDPHHLSRDEHARAARFVFDRDRIRYLAGRARLRCILGRYLGLPPEKIVFDYGPYGRPSVRGIVFNLSHTGDLALLAVTRDVALGVDIETVREIDMGVADAHFSPSEIEALHALPTVQRTAAFYRCWTRKEAYLKAKGTGLSTALASFTVSLGPDDPARLLFCASGEEGEWTLHDLAPASEIVGALALRAGGRAVTLVHRGSG